MTFMTPTKNSATITRAKGEDMVHGPYFVLFGALTTETSFDMVKNRIIQSGFARRSIFQYGERRFDQPCPFPPRRPRETQAPGEHHSPVPIAPAAHRRIPDASGHQGLLRQLVYRAQPQLLQGALAPALLAHLQTDAGVEVKYAHLPELQPRPRDHDHAHRHRPRFPGPDGTDSLRDFRGSGAQ